jgi:hypothetical protein
MPKLLVTKFELNWSTSAEFGPQAAAVVVVVAGAGTQIVPPVVVLVEVVELVELYTSCA